MNDIKIKERRILESKLKKSPDKDYLQTSPEKYKSIYSLNKLNNNKYLSNTAQNFKKINPLNTISNFKGFFNKKFNLTKYKDERHHALILSRSIEKIIKPHPLRGNGIPKDAAERIKYLKKIFISEKFQNYYKARPKKDNATFEKMTEYIINYKKKCSELEAVMMAFYFVCHEIKYLRNNDNITMKNLKYSQKPENVFEAKRALSIGFTNIFEYLLKKMEVRHKHIEGYCKLIPKNNTRFMINTNSTINLNINNSNLNTSPNNTINSNSPEKENNDDPSQYINHCWNAVYLKREWYFVDTLLASGGVDDVRTPTNQEDTNCVDMDFNFNPFYFMILPQYLIITHRPKEDLWQFTEKTLTFKQFLNRNYDDYSRFYKGIYQNDIEFLTHSNPFIKMSLKDNLVIKLRLRNSLLGADLYNTSGMKVLEIKYSYEESTEIFTFEPTFPNSGEFIIKITSRSVASTDLVYWPLIDYIVKVENKLNFSYFDKYKKRMRAINRPNNNKEIILPKLNKTINSNFYQPKIITDYMKIFPSKLNKKICYDNEGFHLIEPRTYYLKKGAVIKFKVRMKGASSIAILDGNQLFNLKKTERNVYEGEKEIQSDNVCICCLRGKNLFTEVFRFKQLKEKSVDTKMFMFKIRKRKFD